MAVDRWIDLRLSPGVVPGAQQEKQMAMTYTTKEMTASRIFMRCVSAKAAMQSDKLAQILDRSGRKDEQSSDGTYIVSFAVNGVELDFKEFEDLIVKAYDAEITEAAGKLVKELIGDKLMAATDGIYEALDYLKDGVQEQAAKALGYNPWKKED